MNSHNSYNLEVNKKARWVRHSRLLGRYSFLNLIIRRAAQLFETELIKTKPKTRFVHFENAEMGAMKVSLVTPRSVYHRMAAISAGLFLVTGFMVNGFEMTFAQGGTQEIGGTGTYILDEQGYFTKANPQTFDGQRIVKDKLIHGVEEGENVSLLATRYGIKTETLLWENGLSLGSTLRIGQKLVIPPIDGVTHTVQTNETVDKIAAKYKIDKSLIVAHNSLQNEVIQKGQQLFLPSAKPIAIEQQRAIYRDAPARTGTTSRLANTDVKPIAGKFMIFPTVGKLTQGYRRGHYAFDIGNRSKPPIWAAANGTVTKAYFGGWGGGYGNHVIVDHGNGVQTLYAHMESLSVKAGESIAQGQVIGRMGNTGRVRGVTGIHLHFEVIDSGLKRVPSNYY